MTKDDDLAIPAFLRRPVTSATKGAVTRLNNDLRGGERRLEATGGRSSISAGHSLNLDETGKAILKEISTENRKKRGAEKKAMLARFAALKKEKAMAKVGTKEKALRAKRETVKTSDAKLQAAWDDSMKKKPGKLSALAADVTKDSDVTDIPNSELFGDDLRKPEKTKKAAKPVANDTPVPDKPVPAKGSKKPAKKAAAKAKPETQGDTIPLRPDGLREGSRQAQMLDMAARKSGATEEEICKALGWKRCRVTLKRVCDRVGAKLERDEKGRFHAVLKKAA